MENLLRRLATVLTVDSAGLLEPDRRDSARMVPEDLDLLHLVAQNRCHLLHHSCWDLCPLTENHHAVCDRTVADSAEAAGPVGTDRPVPEAVA